MSRESSWMSALLALMSLPGCGASEPSAGMSPVLPEPATELSATAPSEPTAKAPTPAAEGSASPPASATIPDPAASAKPLAALPPGIKVLVIGDSFAEALGVGLKAQEQESGWKFSLRGEKATFIPEWAGPNRGVPLLMAQTKPDLVVIALGGNELAIKTPEIRAPKVQKLVSLLGDTPCVWVTPPLWDLGDNGLIQVIRDNSRPCRLFDSSKEAPDLPRGSDKIHPTAAGQRQWAELFLNWLRKEQQASVTPFGLRPRPSAE